MCQILLATFSCYHCILWEFGSLGGFSNMLNMIWYISSVPFFHLHYPKTLHFMLTTAPPWVLLVSSLKMISNLQDVAWKSILSVESCNVIVCLSSKCIVSGKLYCEHSWPAEFSLYCSVLRRRPSGTCCFLVKVADLKMTVYSLTYLMWICISWIFLVPQNNVTHVNWFFLQSMPMQTYTHIPISLTSFE